MKTRKITKHISLKDYITQTMETQEITRTYVEARVSDYLSRSRDDGDFYDQPWVSLDVLAN